MTRNRSLSLSPFPSAICGAAFVSALFIATMVGTVAATEQPRPDGQRSGRYTMTPADGGFVRLDTESGAMALCARRNDRWSCDPMPDAEDAQRREIEGLKAENKALKDEIRRMEDVMGLGEPKPGEGGPKQAERPKGGLGLPSEQDVDKAFDYVQRMLKKFQERMRELESGQGPGKGPGKGDTPL